LLRALDAYATELVRSAAVTEQDLRIWVLLYLLRVELGVAAPPGQG